MVDLPNQRRRGAFDHQVWPASPHHIGAIRAAVYHWLAPLALEDDTRDDVVLAVSEAASNAVEHAYPPTVGGVVELTLWTEPATRRGR